MGENSKIEWTEHTFNPWIGCTRVSQGCVHCYAEAFTRRFGKAEWGPTAQRVRTSAANWKKPLAWNRKAEQEGRRAKVFCASLADVFEDNPQLVEWRQELFELIAQTPNLDWLLLTKRPQNIESMLKAVKTQGGALDGWGLLKSGCFSNVWLGTSVENQAAAEERIPALLEIPATVRFLSCEPLLGLLDLSKWLYSCPACGLPQRDIPYAPCDYCRTRPTVRGVDWVIVGGESGQEARPLHEDWSRRLRAQCRIVGVPFFFKQWGQFIPVGQTDTDRHNSGELMFAADKQTSGRFIRLRSKHDAGRKLDGYEWNEMPEARE